MDPMLKSFRYVGDRAIVALLLDYDGTLSPIAQRPEMATIPPDTKAVLERLANHPDVFIAIVSGRSQLNVKEMVGIEGITYAGNHGMEILHSDGSSFVHPMPDEYQGKLENLLKELKREVSEILFLKKENSGVYNHQATKQSIVKQIQIISYVRYAMKELGSKIKEYC